MSEQNPRPSGMAEDVNRIGGQVAEKMKDLVHEGNIRRVVLRRNGRTVVEFPLTVGVIGTLLAPQIAAIGVVVALITGCSFEVQGPAQPPTAG